MICFVWTHLIILFTFVMFALCYGKLNKNYKCTCVFSNLVFSFDVVMVMVQTFPVWEQSWYGILTEPTIVTKTFIIEVFPTNKVIIGVLQFVHTKLCSHSVSHSIVTN